MPANDPAEAGIPDKHVVKFGPGVKFDERQGGVQGTSWFTEHKPFWVGNLCQNGVHNAVPRATAIASVPNRETK